MVRPSRSMVRPTRSFIVLRTERQSGRAERQRRGRAAAVLGQYLGPEPRSCSLSRPTDPGLGLCLYRTDPGLGLCLTVQTLGSGCVFTAQTLGSGCVFTAQTLGSGCVFTAQTLGSGCVFTVQTLGSGCVFTAQTLARVVSLPHRPWARVVSLPHRPWARVVSLPHRPWARVVSLPYRPWARVVSLPHRPWARVVSLPYRPWARVVSYRTDPGLGLCLTVQTLGSHRATQVAVYQVGRRSWMGPPSSPRSRTTSVAPSWPVATSLEGEPSPPRDCYPSLLDPKALTEACGSDGLIPEGGYWQLCAARPLQGGLLSSSFPPGPLPLSDEEALAPPPAPPPGPLAPPPPPPPKRHCRSLSVPEDLSRCRYTWRPSASRVWTPVARHCPGAVGGVASAVSGAVAGAVGGSSLNSSLHSSSSPTFFSLALSPDSPLPWSFPWEEPGGGACCCFFPSPSSCSSPSPLHPPPPQRRFSLSPVLIRDSGLFHPPHAPPPAPQAPPPNSACSTPSSLRRPLPPAPRCHSQPCDLLLLKPGLKRRREGDRAPGRPGLDFTKMTQTRSMDPGFCLERGRLGSFSGGDVCISMEPFLGDFRGSCSPADLLGRSSIGPLSESDEECPENPDEEEEEGEEGEAGDRDTQPVFERDCTELDLNLIEEN
uniref:Protein FAM53C n=1 Tax=Knipowitschia caucasica TaxID=637954 RepID=A0AAV2J7L0_KNICA